MFRGEAAWPVDGGPKLVSTNTPDGCTDAGWGPQDASHPKPDETCQDDDMRSPLGALAIMMGGPIDWSAEREKDSVSRSVCQSEIKGMDLGCNMLLGLRHPHDDLGFTAVNTPTPLLCSNNQGGLAWVKSEAIAKWLKHMNAHKAAIRQDVKAGRIDATHIPGKLNLSDTFVKEMHDTQHCLCLLYTSDAADE